MSNQFGLRNLLLITTVVAACMLTIAYSIRNRGDYVAIAVLVCIAMVIVTFLLFGLMFAILLPFGVLEAMARESVTPATSPFSTDRLPDQQLVPTDLEPLR